MHFIYKQFKKSRMRPGLSYNEEQIHKLDKVNFSHLAKRLLQVFQEECAQTYQVSLVTHGKRMRQVQKAQNHLHLIGHSVATCNSEARGAQESLAKVCLISSSWTELPNRELRSHHNLWQLIPAPIRRTWSSTCRNFVMI